MLDMSKFKAFADNNLNVAKMAKLVSDNLENIVGNAFSPFPTMFSKVLFHRVVKSQDCVVKGHRVDPK